jgi:hypothetical protein
VLSASAACSACCSALRARGIAEQGDRVGFPVGEFHSDRRRGADFIAAPRELGRFDEPAGPSGGLGLDAPGDRLVGFGFLGEQQGGGAVLARDLAAAQIPEQHAGVRHQARMDLEQPTRLAQALTAAPQERVHVPVQRENFAEYLPRGNLGMNLGEIDRRPVYLLDGIVGRISGGHPRGHAQGVVWDAIRLRFSSARLCCLQAKAAVEQFIPFGQLMIAALPAADHPDEGVVRGDRLAGDTTELACRLRHVPPMRPAPLAQRPAIDPGQGPYLRVSWHIREHEPVLPKTPSYSHVSLSHDSPLPVNWNRHVGTR